MAWDDTHQTAADPDNPNADEEITANEWNAMVRELKSSRTADWVVYKDSGGTWHAEGPDGATDNSGSSPTTILQHAANQSEGNSIHLASSVDAGEALSSTVVIDKSFIGPGVRNQGHIYVGAADPGLRFEGEGIYERMWLRGQNNTNDLVVFRDCGRGTVIKDLTCFNTNGNGAVFQGVQQASVQNLTFGKCGDPSNDTGELRLDNSPTDGLESNAINIFGLHSHGGSDPQGTTVQMRASDSAGGDRPRNIHIMGVNIENGPSAAVPVIELCGRDNWVRGGRVMGLDNASAVFQIQDPRAPSMHIRDIVAIGATGAPLRFVSNAATTAASSQSAALDDMPSIEGCDVDTDGVAIFADSYNQSDNPLVISNTDFYGTGGAIDVAASSDQQPTVRLSSLGCGGQEIRVQGARLTTSGIDDATYPADFGDQFGPHLISDDGSYSRLHEQTADTNASGIARLDYRGIVQFPTGATVDARISNVTTGSRPFFLEWQLVDLSGDGINDAVEATVYDDSGATVGDGDVTVEFNVRPHT